MSRRMQENLVALVLAGVFVGVIAMSLGYGPRARLVPIPVAAIGLILTVIQIIWQNVSASDDLRVDLLDVLTRQDGAKAASREHDDDAGHAHKREEKGGARREAAAFALVLGFLGAVLLLGPIPAIFLLTCGYFMVSRHYSPLRSFVYSLGFTTAVYLLFVVALQIQLYHGVLQPVVDRFS